MTASRYEKIIGDANALTLKQHKDDRWPFLCGQLKTEIRYLLKEIETMEAKNQSFKDVLLDVCNGDENIYGNETGKFFHIRFLLEKDILPS